MKKVSIIIPLFNRAYCIEETINSILCQTMKDFELIIVDDGSIDNSKEIVSGISHKDKRIRLIERNRQPKGACTCRNIGIENSVSEFILFFDSDDIMTETCLEHRLRHIENQSRSYDFYVFQTQLFKKEIGDYSFFWNILNSKDIMDRFLNLDVVWHTNGVVWNRKSIIKIGGWDEKLLSWQDWELHLRAMIAGFKYYINLSISDVHIRFDELNSISGKAKSMNHLKSHYYTVKKLYGLSKRTDTLTKAREIFYIRLFFWISRLVSIAGNSHLALTIWKYVHSNEMSINAYKWYLIRGYLIARNSNRYLGWFMKIVVHIFANKYVSIPSSKSFRNIPTSALD